MATRQRELTFKEEQHASYKQYPGGRLGALAEAAPARRGRSAAGGRRKRGHLGGRLGVQHSKIARGQLRAGGDADSGRRAVLYFITAATSSARVGLRSEVITWRILGARHRCTASMHVRYANPFIFRRVFSHAAVAEPAVTPCRRREGAATPFKQFEFIARRQGVALPWICRCTSHQRAGDSLGADC